MGEYLHVIRKGICRAIVKTGEMGHEKTVQAHFSHKRQVKRVSMQYAVKQAVVNAHKVQEARSHFRPAPITVLTSPRPAPTSKVNATDENAALHEIITGEQKAEKVTNDVNTPPVYITSAILTVGQFFGENVITQRRCAYAPATILSDTKVELLSIHTSHLFKLKASLNEETRNRIERTLRFNFPKASILLNQYNKKKKWESQKRQIIDDILADRDARDQRDNFSFR
eukprot:TRINITY_DN48215_c0_g1_i4.p1 TRINITY_DN48215_c0_g1~~TRINITY_DN48215_c0_g1_i4.p1  ORF type:complete len:227 (+),score=56.35 TRINITY_DN48215_c0_g1_i4:437-1117(+)